LFLIIISYDLLKKNCFNIYVMILNTISSHNKYFCVIDMYENWCTYGKYICFAKQTDSKIMCNIPAICILYTIYNEDF